MTPLPDTTPKQPSPPIPLTVITGFLGAGKTTFLNRILADPLMRDTAVIINEFGDIGLDNLLVEHADEGIVELSSGCLCCTIRGDLVNTLEDLLRRLDNGRIEHLARVVIETTGLADPAPVLHTVMLHPYLVMRYRLDGVITLVDAVNGADTLDGHEEAVKQIAVADRIILSKTDLLGNAGGRRQIDDLLARIRLLNPAAPVLKTSNDIAVIEIMNSGLYDPDSKIPDVRRWLSQEAYRESHATHGDDHGDAHDINRHGQDIRAFSVTIGDPVPAPGFEMFLDLLRSAHGPKLLRVKGIVHLADDPDRPMVIHGVQHVFHPPARLPAWPDEDRNTRIVFITRDLSEGFVRRMLDAFTGAIAVDTPDRAALTDNPLSIPGVPNFTPGRR